MAAPRPAVLTPPHPPADPGLPPPVVIADVKDSSPQILLGLKAERSTRTFAMEKNDRNEIARLVKPNPARRDGQQKEFFRGRIGPIPRFDQGAEIALLAEHHGDTAAFVPTAIDEKYLARPMPAAPGPAR